KQAPAINGKMVPEQALAVLLENSGLKYARAEDGSITISEQSEEEEVEIRKAEDSKKEVEELVTTGSRIVKDPGKLTRQITAISREELEASGITRLDEYLSRLP